MKLTFFIGSLSGGGTERVTCNLANYLVSHGHEIDILTMSDLEPSYKLDKAVVHIPLIAKSERKNYIYNAVKRVYRLQRYLKKNDRDCYLTMLATGTILLILLKKSIKSPIIASERADPTTNYKWQKWALRRLAKHADGFVFQTKDAQTWYQGCLNMDWTTVIPNAINTEFCLEKFQGERRKEIVSAGRFVHGKNFSLLLQAFAKIEKTFKEYSLVLYGDGILKEQLWREAQNLGICNKLKMPGYINDLGERMRESSLFVLSSDYQGMPNVLIEAMALGLPCISTDCPSGGPRFLIEDGKNGLLVPVGNVDAMAEAMTHILNNPIYAEQLGENAAHISQRLDPTKIYQQWEDFLISVSERKKYQKCN